MTERSLGAHSFVVEVASNDGTILKAFKRRHVRVLGVEPARNIAAIAETTTPSYDDLRAEISYKWRPVTLSRDDLSEATFGISGSNLLNRDIRNSVSYSKDQVLMPGASVRLFTTVKY